ncbi:MAG: M23 family metallopeptidase [Rikenellaceae bacterium]
MFLNFIFSYFFSTPKMWSLREDALESVAKYELLQKEIALKSEELYALKWRERNVYSSVFSQDTIAFAEKRVHYHSPDNYGRYNDLVAETESMLSSLKEDAYRVSVSLDEVEYLALNKDVMADRVPAIWPLDRTKLRNHIGAFGYRMHPTMHKYIHHDGVDLSGPTGLAIVATGNGTIEKIENKSTGYGKQIVVDHGFGYKTRYAHLSKIEVTVGQEVKRGEKIGELGNTGRSTGPHLHYEVLHRGKPVNPVSYFSRDMDSEEYMAILANARATTYEDEEGDDVENTLTQPSQK